MPPRLLRAASALLLAALLIPAGAALAHGSSVAVLSLQAEAPGRFQLRWDAHTLDHRPPETRFPAHCRRTGALLDCGERGLTGPLIMPGLGTGFAAAVVEINRDGMSERHVLTAARPTLALGARGDGPAWPSATIATAIRLGLAQTLLGVEHLLFLFGLLWLARSAPMRVGAFAAFTGAWAMGLAVVSLGWIGFPERPVGAAIALSIVFVAAEAIKRTRGHQGLAVRRPWVVALAFGPLHGLGLADTLARLGLDPVGTPATALGFGIGTAIGLTGIALLALVLRWSHRVLDLTLPARTALVPAYCVGSLGTIWLLERVLTLARLG